MKTGVKEIAGESGFCFLRLDSWKISILTMIFFTIAIVNTVKTLNPDSQLKLFDVPLNKTARKSENSGNPKIQKNIEKNDFNFGETSSLYTMKFPKLTADEEKKNDIFESFKHAWEGYKKYAWGKDFLNPVSKSGSNVFIGGLTITDSLDMLAILGMNEEIEECKKWIEENFVFNGEYSVFEITIRHLGGFIGAYQQTKDKFFLDKAIYVADSLMEAFSTSTGYFKTYALFKQENNKTKLIPKGDDSALISDLGGIQLEFYTLSRITGDSKYAKAVSRIHKKLFHDFPDGLLPERVRITNGGKNSDIKSLDSMSDSYYEYLIKIYLISNGSQKKYLSEYLKAVNKTKSLLVVKGNDNTYLGRRKNNRLLTQMSHLVTFAPGMLALGSITENSDAQADLKLADELVSTYAKIYMNRKTGLMPETLTFREGSDDYTPNDKQYQLRPETIESLFYLYRFTGLPKYRDYAWKIYESIEKYCKVKSGGYSTIANVDEQPPFHRNQQDSFFLAETLKYLYLIFCDEKTIPITEYVFNTEAHPLRVWSKEQAKEMAKYIDVE